ncbi:MAG: DUF2779 domain-containing protein [Candidatus Omnitrophica bacterium]|nr:DUF2779 domain-containing protein [Candidatus Omnitrophota bacterium]
MKKIISLLIISSFLLQKITFADTLGQVGPGGDNLQVGSMFNPIGDHAVIQDTLVRMLLEYAKGETLIDKFEERLTLKPFSGLQPVLDFSGKYSEEGDGADGKSDRRLIVPCHVIDTGTGECYSTEAVFVDGGFSELRTPRAINIDGLDGNRSIVLERSADAWRERAITREEHSVMRAAFSGFRDKGYEIGASDEVLVDVRESLKALSKEGIAEIVSPPGEAVYREISRIANDQGVVSLPGKESFALVTYPAIYQDEVTSKRSYELLIPQECLAYVRYLRAERPELYKEWLLRQTALLSAAAYRTDKKYPEAMEALAGYPIKTFMEAYNGKRELSSGIIWRSGAWGVSCDGKEYYPGEKLRGKELRAALLTKARYFAGEKCSRSLWEMVKKGREEEESPDIRPKSTGRGGATGELAKYLFPEGKEIPYDDLVAGTRSTLAFMSLSDRKPIFNAAILAGDELFATIDVLKPAGDEGWDIIGVTSSTSAKEDSIAGIAFQRYVAEKAGIKIRNSYVLHINKDYRQKGQMDLAEYFIMDDVTEKTGESIAGVREKVPPMLEIVRADNYSAVSQIGSHCSDPEVCPLKEICWGALPAGNVYELYRGGKTSKKLHEQGISMIADIPDNVKLTYRQVIQRDCALSKEPHIDRKNLIKFLNTLEGPVSYLDFETFAEPAPRFKNTNPYQRIAFQFSLHVADKGNEVEHYSYLAEGADDPRPGFLAALKGYLGDKGSIVVYNKSFELSVLKELSEDFPEYKEWIESLTPRVVDLLDPFREFYYYHSDQHGSCSIKKVLPVLTGESYQSLDIGKGDVASDSFVRVTYGDVPEEERLKVRDDLLVYCGLDTRGMILIMDKLKEITGYDNVSNLDRHPTGDVVRDLDESKVSLTGITLGKGGYEAARKGDGGISGEKIQAIVRLMNDADSFKPSGFIARSVLSFRYFIYRYLSRLRSPPEMALYRDLSPNAARYKMPSHNRRLILFDEYFIDSLLELKDRELASYLLHERLSHELMHTGIRWPSRMLREIEEFFVILFCDISNYEGLVTGKVGGESLNQRIDRFFIDREDTTSLRPSGFASNNYYGEATAFLRNVAGKPFIEKIKRTWAFVRERFSGRDGTAGTSEYVRAEEAGAEPVTGMYAEFTPASAIGLLDSTLLTREEYHEGIHLRAAVENLAVDAVKYGAGGICVYPDQLAWVKGLVKGSGIKLSAVIAFPGGLGEENGYTTEKALREARVAVANGAMELDVVINYKAILDGRAEQTEEELKAFSRGVLHEFRGRIKIKAILETAALGSEENIRRAARIALPYSDFIKTSTGKHEKGGATLTASKFILEEIKEYHAKTGSLVGHKPSGGIKVWEDEQNPDAAMKKYLILAESIMGMEYARDKNLMRIGAGGLLGDMLKRSPRVYLCGAIESLADKDAGALWRQRIAPKLRETGFIPLDPLLSARSPEDRNALQARHRLKREGNWREHGRIMGRVIEDDLEMVQETGNTGGFTLVYLDAEVNAFGTFCEMMESYARGIPVYVVAPNNPPSDLHNMTLLLATRVFRSFEEFNEFARSSYDKGEKTEDKIFDGLIPKALWNKKVAPITPENDPRGARGRRFYVTSQMETPVDSGVGTRKSLADKLRKLGADVRDPGESFHREGPLEGKLLKHLKRTGDWERFREEGYKVIRQNMALITSASGQEPEDRGAMVVFVDEAQKPSGTAIDMWNAYVRGIPIYLILDPAKPVAEYNSWMINMATVVFTCEDDLLIYLERSPIKRALLKARKSLSNLFIPASRQISKEKSTITNHEPRLAAVALAKAGTTPALRSLGEGGNHEIYWDAISRRMELKYDGIESPEKFFKRVIDNGIKKIAVPADKIAAIKGLVEKREALTGRKSYINITALAGSSKEMNAEKLGVGKVEAPLDVSLFRKGNISGFRDELEKLYWKSGKKKNLVAAIDLRDFTKSEIRGLADFLMANLPGNYDRLNINLKNSSPEEAALLKSILGWKCGLVMEGVDGFSFARELIEAGTDVLRVSDPGRILSEYREWQSADPARKDIRDVEKIFEEELSFIHDPKIRAFALEGLKMMPDYIWEVPSSSTGKYHPQDEISFGGQVLHVRRVARNALRIAGAYELPQRGTDIMVAAALLHDAAKYGLNDDEYYNLDETDGGKPSRWEQYRKHPQLVRELIGHLKSRYAFTDEVIGLIETHEGVWSSEGYKPRSLDEWLLHLADYSAGKRYSLDLGDFIACHKALIAAGCGVERAMVITQKAQDGSYGLLKELEKPTDIEKNPENIVKIREFKRAIYRKGLERIYGEVLEAGDPEEAKKEVSAVVSAFIKKYRIKVYLAGYIEADFGGAGTWRNMMKPYLEDMLVEVRDPMDKDFNSEDLAMEQRKNWLRVSELWDDFREQLGDIIDGDLAWVVGGKKEDKGVQIVVANLVPKKQTQYLDAGVQTYGTPDEMKEARKQGGRVLIFTPNDRKELYNFELGFGHDVFHQQAAVLEYIKEHADELRDYANDDIHEGTPLEDAYWVKGMRPVPEGEDKKGIKGRKFYISVPVEPSADMGAGERARIRKEIEKRGGQVIDPLDDPLENDRLTKLRQEGRWPEFEAYFKEIYKRNLAKINEADAMIVAVDPSKRYVETTTDTWPAFVLGKPIYVISPTSWRKLSDWLTGLYTKKFTNIGNLVTYLTTSKDPEKPALADFGERLANLKEMEKNAAKADAPVAEELNLLIVRGITKLLNIQRAYRADTDEEIAIGIESAARSAARLDKDKHKDAIEKLRDEFIWWIEKKNVFKHDEYSVRSRRIRAALESVGYEGPGAAPGFKKSPYIKRGDVLFRDLTVLSERARNFVELVLSAKVTADKLVFAFDNGIGGEHSKDIISVISAIEELKKEPEFKSLLENVVILAPSKPGALPRKLRQYMKDKDAEVFVFSRESSRKKFRGIENKVHMSYIREEADSDISTDAPYYPLLEVVIVSLARHLDSSILDIVNEKLKGTNIRSVEEEGDALIFNLLPNAEYYPAEQLRDIYNSLKRFIKSA